MPSNQNVVFFDIDGTLLDHAASEETAAAALWGCSPSFSKLSLNQFLKKWREQSEFFLNLHLAGKISFQEQRIRRVQALTSICGHQTNEQEAEALFSYYLAEYERSWRLFDDVRAALERLRTGGYRLGVISNGDPVQQQLKLRQSGIAEYFDPVIISGGIGAAKPSTEIFRIACERAAVCPESAWYIGDRLDIDAEASHSAGLNAVWLSRAPASPPSPVHILKIKTLLAEEFYSRLRPDDAACGAKTHPGPKRAS